MQNFKHFDIWPPVLLGLFEHCLSHTDEAEDFSKERQESILMSVVDRDTHEFWFSDKRRLWTRRAHVQHVLNTVCLNTDTRAASLAINTINTLCRWKYLHCCTRPTAAVIDRQIHSVQVSTEIRICLLSTSTQNSLKLNTVKQLMFVYHLYHDFCEKNKKPSCRRSYCLTEDYLVICDCC